MSGLTPKKAGFQSTRSARLPTSIEPTSWLTPWARSLLTDVASRSEPRALDVVSERAQEMLVPYDLQQMRATDRDASPLGLPIRRPFRDHSRLLDMQRDRVDEVDDIALVGQRKGVRSRSLLSADHMPGAVIVGPKINVVDTQCRGSRRHQADRI